MSRNQTPYINFQIMTKNIFLPAVLLCLSALVTAQTKEANISFNSESHDFGKIEEAKGNVTHRFEFTNTGSTPLIISRVQPSCGCTTPEWSKEPVLPGQTGYVAATYNPRNRPGPFNKSITVVTNANPSTKILRIMGEVTPKPKTIEDEYRYALTKIRMKSNHLGFAGIAKGRTETKSMEVINTSEDPVALTFNRVPAYMKVTAKPEKLQPNEKGVIQVTYNSALKDDWGFVSDRINILENGEFQSRNRLTVSATLQEDFSKMTPEEKANAPRIAFNEKTYNFDEIKQGQKIEHEFMLKNEGKSDLYIRKIRASCGCTTVNPDTDVIKPGESTSLKVIFNSAGKIGNQNKSITVITNDPNHTREVLWIRGSVVKT